MGGHGGTREEEKAGKGRRMRTKRSGVLTRVQFSEGLPPKIFEGEKTSKIRRNF